MRTILAIPFVVVGIVLGVAALVLAVIGYFTFVIGAIVGGENER